MRFYAYVDQSYFLKNNMDALVFNEIHIYVKVGPVAQSV